MFNLRTAAVRRAREEGEKPFWISFSDLMSALMVLFLVAMSVALLAVTKKISSEEKGERERQTVLDGLKIDIEQILTAKEFEGVRLNETTIDFGPRVRFGHESNSLSQDERDLLLSFTPKLLAVLQKNDAYSKWFKRTIVEGYASQSGSYLYNLNLSLERSARVICELLKEPPAGRPALTEQDRELIATSFFVGGASFNSLQKSEAESRRIEFKLEFKSRSELEAERTQPKATVDRAVLLKALDPKERCPLANRG
jgi:outer membrane protein OmpA-like peptidoglycan-associated protein